MKIVVLLSAGRHPHSGAPRPVPVEMQAIALAHSLRGANIIGLHAGAADEAIGDSLGHGLRTITLLRVDPEADQCAALTAEIRTMAPDLVLAGRRGMGGADGGLLPYRLARACAMPIASDAVAVTAEGGHFTIIQSLPRGQRRRLVVDGPALVTVHEQAPPAWAFVFADRRTGVISDKASVAGTPAPGPEIEVRPYRQRPKLIGDGASSEVKGRLMVHPDPSEAAEAVLEYLGAFRKSK